jgi:hypothetical protein
LIPQCSVSITVSVGVEKPLLVMTRKRPSGVAVIDRGKSPAGRCLPAGLMRQPLGSSVTPRPCTPGRCDEPAAAGAAAGVAACAAGRTRIRASASYWSLAMKSTPASRAARQRVSAAAGDPKL